MTIPTLETEAGALTLRIADGTSGDHVAFDDVWNWPDGVAAGNGDVPKDGGGTVKVNTFLSEIVANAVYIIHKNFDFGDGSTSTFFKSLNEQIYFDDGKVWQVKSAATCQRGELSSGFGINGSMWSVNPSTVMQAIRSGGTTANDLYYGSRLHLRDSQKTIQWNTGIYTFNKAVISSTGITGGTFQFLAGTPSFQDVDLLNIKDFTIAVSPAVFDEVHTHVARYGVLIRGADAELTGLKWTATSQADLRELGPDTVHIINPRADIADIVIDNANGQINKEHTVNITVNDRNGAALESATVAMTSFGNIVSNDSGSTFYRCIVDHTAGTFATDVSAGKWELTTAANAALAGGVDSDGNPTPLDGTAKNGEWITGIDYVAAAEVFSVSTASDGTISQQTEMFKKWRGTSVALLSSSPHTLVISKATFETLTKDNISLTAPITSTTPEELLPVLAETDVKQDVEYGEDKTGTYDIDHMAGAVALGAVAVSGVMGVARATVTEAKAEFDSGFATEVTFDSAFTAAV